MHVSNLDLLGVSNCILSLLSLARSQETCVCKCEVASVSPGSHVIREIINHQSSQRIPEFYFPWWLFILVLIIGVCIGVLLDLLVRKSLALLGRLSDKGQQDPRLLSVPEESTADAPAATPVTPRTLSLRDGRAR